MKTPKISVLMSVYNGKAHLKESIESILSQSFRDFEFIIINDYSTDRTLEILEEYRTKDNRIRIVNNPKNIGLTKSLNKGIKIAKGEYIARMDADDLSYPDRLKLQIEFLETHLSYGLVGTWGIEIDIDGSILKKKRLFASNDDLKKELIKHNPFFHSSIMMRKEVLKRVGLYNESWKYSQDYELYFRIIRVCKIANLPLFLIKKRQLVSSITYSKNKEQTLLAIRARKKALSDKLYPKTAYVYIILSFIGYVIRLLSYKFMRENKLKETGNKDAKSYKVCHVVSTDISLKFLLFDFLKSLKADEFEPYAVSSNGRWVQEIRSSGIPVKTIGITRRLFTPISDIIAFFQLFFFFRKERFDIVHTHTPKAMFLGQLAAFFARVPIRITTIHGLYFQENSSWQKKIIFIPIEKIVAKIVHRAFSVNREDIEFLLKRKIYLKEKITYIGGGINLTKFNPERFSQKFIIQKKRSLGIPLEVKIIGIVARLVKEKGFLPLFDAFSSVVEQFPDAILLVIGPKESEKRDALDLKVVDEYGIKDKVIFLGERTDVIELYALMDVFVLPSFREGLGLSVLEASAMERPVVASDIRGCREAVDDKKTGLLVPSNNPAELAKALLYILSNPETAKEMGKAGRIKVEKEFNERDMFDNIKKEYQALIEKNL